MGILSGNTTEKNAAEGTLLPFAGSALPSRAGLICPTAAAAPPATVAAIVAPAATSLLRAGPVFPTSVSSMRD